MSRHPARAVLRRLLDEPDAVDARDREHAATCPVCLRRQDAMAAAAAEASAVLGAAAPVRVDPLPALRRLRSSEVSFVPPKPGLAERVTRRVAFARRRTLRVGAVSAVVVLAMGTLVATGAAGGLVRIFQPDSFVPVSINLSSLTTLPDLSGFGSEHVVQVPSVTTTATEAAAAAASGLTLLTPGRFPSGIKANTTYLVATQGSGSFTFDASTASASAGKLGKTLPALPADLNGSTLTLQGGPIVAELIGSQSTGGLLGQFLGATSGTLHHVSRAAPGTKATVAPPPEGTAGRGIGKGLLGSLSSIPQLAIVQMRAPALYSNGPTVQQYEDALLSMPGVPASLAAQIRSLGNLSSTLPIPIPTSLASSYSADINGAPGLVIGDTTGIASAVIWQKGGMLYAVVGSLTDHQVVDIARSLH